jgi:hypothetical protein
MSHGDSGTHVSRINDPLYAAYFYSSEYILAGNEVLMWKKRK